VDQGLSAAGGAGGVGAEISGGVVAGGVVAGGVVAAGGSPVDGLRFEEGGIMVREAEGALCGGGPA
jgi:hypothetical protein